MIHITTIYHNWKDENSAPAVGGSVIDGNLDDFFALANSYGAYIQGSSARPYFLTKCKNFTECFTYEKL